MQSSNEINYGVYRHDQEAEPGYSKTMYNVNLQPEFYDTLSSLPHHLTNGNDTMLSLFGAQVSA